LISCPRCAQLLPDWLFRDSYINSICPQCSSALDVYSFPALYRTTEKVSAAELAIPDGEACCYEHASRRAASLCSNCGRFLCTLCEIQLGTLVLCPDCLQTRKGASPVQALDTHRTKYDSIALALATWPLLIFYFTVITAPLAFGMAIYAWNRPTSIVRHNRWRLFAAMGISSLEIAGIVALIVTIVNASRHKL